MVARAFAILTVVLLLGCDRGSVVAVHNGIEIVGDANFVKQVETALGTLSTESPDGYKVVTKFIGRIEPELIDRSRSYKGPASLLIRAFWRMCTGSNV